MTGKEGKFPPRMSVVSAIEGALYRHLKIYHEQPVMVLVGPSELEILIGEIARLGLTYRINKHLSVFDMIVVPKCADGIDFNISCKASQQALFNRAGDPRGN